MKFVRRGLILCCLMGLLAGLTGCSKEPEKIEPQGKAYFSYFDTVSYVYSYAGDSAERFESRSAEVADILKEYHQLFDIYHEYSGINNLCTVNRLAGGDPIKVDERLISFLKYALDLHEKTNGEMNILLGPVLSIWHDYRTEGLDDPTSARLPTHAELFSAAQHTDISLLEIDEQNSTVRLADPQASIDVGALGKGYATEKAAQHLATQDANGYVLNIGGNIRIIGTKPDGSGWVTGVRDPKNPSESFAANVLLKDISCVTSGSYERFYTVAGKQYHHIIDKDTLWPAEQFASLTVFNKDSGLADALSTALFCMSYEDGTSLTEEIPGVDVLWVFHDGEIRYTPGLADKFVD